MKQFLRIFLSLIPLFTLAACGTAEAAVSDSTSVVNPSLEFVASTMSVPIEEVVTESGIINITLTIGGDSFSAKLYDNAAAHALTERFPLTLVMEELHGNEKYYYLTEGLPTNPDNQGQINSGDIMLFGSDCLVLFYEDFSNGYSYTKLGSIDDQTDFTRAVGSGEVTITFELS